MTTTFVNMDIGYGRETHMGGQLQTMTGQVFCRVERNEDSEFFVQLGRPSITGWMFDHQNGLIWPGCAIVDLFGHTLYGVDTAGAPGSFCTNCGDYKTWRGQQGYGTPARLNPVWWENDNVAIASFYENTAGTNTLIDWDRMALANNAAALGGFWESEEGFDPGDIRGFEGRVTWANPSGALIGEFWNNQVEAQDAPIRRELQRLGAAGDGICRLVTATVSQCGAAYPRADNNYYIHPDDVGVGEGQLPINPAFNTAARFREHPGVFVRRTGGIRTLVHPYQQAGLPPGDITNTANDQLTAADSGVRVYTIDRAPTHSRWILRMDGVPLDAVLAHPAGTDWRRPRDIYNNVIVPLMASSYASPIPIFDHIANSNIPARVFFNRGWFKHLRYLEVATFVDAFDGDGTDITTPQQTPAPV